MGSYYVRIGGKTHGPFPSDQIKRLAVAGKITRDDELSGDGKSWTPAGNAKGLFPPAEVIVADRPAPPKPRPAAIPTVVRSAPLPADLLMHDIEAAYSQPVPYQPVPPQPQYAPPPQPVVFQPVMQQTTVVNIHGRLTNTVAIIALFFACLAVAFCWIPFLGLLVIPVAALAMFLAAIGGFIALFRHGTGLIMSLGGFLLGIVAIFVSFASTAVGVGGAMEAVDRALIDAKQAAQQAEPKVAPADEPDRQEVVADDNNDFEPAADEPTVEPSTVAAAEPVEEATSATPEVEPPELRTWTSGKHTVEAEFVGKSPKGVQLKRADGKVVIIAESKLSDEDRKWIKDRAKATR